MIPKIRRLLNPPYSPQDILVLLGTFAVLSSVPIAGLMTQQGGEATPQAQATRPSDEEMVEKETLELLDLNSELDKAKGGEKQKIAGQMENVAKERKERLSSIVEKNPEEVLRVGLPEEVKDDLPKKVQEDIEEEVSLKGSLEVLHIDDLDNKQGRFLHFLQTKKEKFSLHAKDPLPIFPSGTNVEVSGVAVEDKIALDGEIKQDPKVLAASDTTGNQNNVVLLVNFQNDTTRRFTKSTAAGVVFNNSNSVNAYYQESSYGKASLSGDVFGWYTLPINKTCSYSSILSEAIKAADPAVNFRNYSGIIIGFPGSCGWAGLAYVGKVNVSTADGTVRTRVSWIIDRYFDLRVVGHEIGHGFGAWHANAYECGSVAIGPSCNSSSYGDPYDIMGSSFSGHFNAYHKEIFSWFDPGNVWTVTENGTFSIEPFETASAGRKIIKLPRDRNASGTPTTWHYLEYRKRTGFDSSLSGNVYDGALVHYGPKLLNTGDVHLLDTRPATSSRTDGALTVGQVFSDPAASVTATPVARTANNLDVDVDIGIEPCTSANPTVTITPTQVFAIPGSTKTFTVTVTNNDTSACGPSTFNLTRTVPAGWSSALSDSQLAINAQGSGSTTLNVTSAASAADGFYNVTATATNQADSNFTANDTATYAVSNDLEDPTVSITSPIEGSTVSGTVNVTASATDNIGVTKVEFYVDGSLESTDTSSPFVFSWDSTSVPNGSHNLTAKAYDAVGNVGTSIAVSVSVSNIDTQPPTVPTNLWKAQVSETQLNLYWNASTDNVGVEGYRIYRDGTLLTTVTTTSHADKTVSLGKTYQYAVSAFDAADNESARSSTLTVTIRDVTRPSTPAGLRARVISGTRVDLVWRASTDNVGVAGYRIYRNGRLIKVTTGRGYSDRGVRSGRTYYYQVAAYDAAGNRSPKSSVVRVTTPGTGTPRKLGDLNGDGRINIRDLSILLSRWRSTNKTSDLNDDGRVDVRDLSILISRWGR